MQDSRTSDDHAGDTMGSPPMDLLRALRDAAGEEETGDRSIAISVDLLRAEGYLALPRTHPPQSTARLLMRVAGANLSLARLLEGHINARHLVDLYADPGVRQSVEDKIGEGAFLGVWGADGASPVQFDPADHQLSGQKIYASGLGAVTHALITVKDAEGQRLALVDVTDSNRADPAGWNMLGMRASASGGYDFSGMAQGSFDWIGQPGDYSREPHLIGGVWRIAALQTGATIGLIEEAASQLRGMGRMDAPAQLARLMSVLAQAWQGAAMTERAAEAIASGTYPAEQILANSIAARLTSEQTGLQTISAVEQSLGLRHFQDGSVTGRIARDLSVYMRQVARDEFLQRAARHALGEGANAWGVFE